ncbi:hypothetical protein RhiJN_09872 [Ceratobasidium sp. AG-Ba]|nr:hypothetical protein RhiJN_09872 [Ceratobasidium sp. AG-Ba]QRW10629.1 hypothetical protein RhiLY_09628 [Ceratobasidium sp. AG-Ba]
MSEDDEFWSLKPSLRRAIDTAFLKLVKLGNETDKGPARKKQRTGQDKEDGRGGFVQDGSDRDSDHDQEDEPNIPLALVPTGLQMLDLPPDDPEVLTVFRNAATGWEDVRAKPRAGAEEPVDRDAGLLVSKDDWRAVCSVLLGQAQEEEAAGTATGRQATSTPSRAATGEGRRQTRSQGKAKAKLPEPGPDSDEGGGFVPDRDEDEEAGGFELEEEEAGSDSDRYSEPDEDEGEDSASEFGDRRRTRRARKAEDDDEGIELEADDLPLALTERQKREARMAFALFFPDMDPNDPRLDTKKIGIREVGEAAKALKEKLSTEDIIEMLSMFSSGPSGTVGLDEFGRMAVMAKLV